jgi:hypothetical protein
MFDPSLLEEVEKLLNDRQLAVKFSAPLVPRVSCVALGCKGDERSRNGRDIASWEQEEERICNASNETLCLASCPILGNPLK